METRIDRCRVDLEKFVARPARLAFLFVGLLQFAACAPVTQRPGIDDAQVKEEIKKQKIVTAQLQIENYKRVERIAEKLRVASPDLCPKKDYSTGMMLFSPLFDSKEWQAIFKLAGYADGLQVLDVSKGSPADLAGIKSGDYILKVDDLTATAKKEDLAKIVSKIGQAGERKITISRQEQTKDFAITGRLSCNYPAQIVSNDAVNAYADGKKIVIHTGIMRFVSSDEELALVIGHEMAHNTRGHIDAQQTNAAVGAVLGGAIQILLGVPSASNIGANIGGAAYSQSFESEADYVGMYFMARAGFDISDAPGMWRRMGAKSPAAISHGSSHPATAERFVSLEKTAQEIKAKLAAGQPLIPNEVNPEDVPRPSIVQQY